MAASDGHELGGGLGAMVQGPRRAANLVDSPQMIVTGNVPRPVPVVWKPDPGEQSHAIRAIHNESSGRKRRTGSQGCKDEGKGEARQMA